MTYNFSIAGIPAGLPFYIARCASLDLFGDLSLGIHRDALRLSYMPSLSIPGDAEPRFYKTAEEAAEFFAGLLRAEIGEARLAEIRAEFAENQDEFAPVCLSVAGNMWVGENCLQQAFQYASGGRPLMAGESAEDDAFGWALFDEFAERFFAQTAAAA